MIWCVFHYQRLPRTTCILQSLNYFLLKWYKTTYKEKNGYHTGQGNQPFSSTAWVTFEFISVAVFPVAAIQIFGDYLCCVSVDHGCKYAKGTEGAIFSDHISFALSQQSMMSMTSSILMLDVSVGKSEHLNTSSTFSVESFQAVTLRKRTKGIAYEKKEKKTDVNLSDSKMCNIEHTAETL